MIDLEKLMINTYFIVCFDGLLSNGRIASKEVCKEILSDKYFQLSEYEEFKKYVLKCSKHKLDYSIIIETFHAIDGNEYSEKDGHSDHIMFKGFINDWFFTIYCNFILYLEICLFNSRFIKKLN